MEKLGTNQLSYAEVLELVNILIIQLTYGDKVVSLNYYRFLGEKHTIDQRQELLGLSDQLINQRAKMQQQEFSGEDLDVHRTQLLKIATRISILLNLDFDLFR